MKFGHLFSETVMDNVRAWQDAGETIVFTNGCFDILHAGHVSYLEGAKALGDKLVVGLNSDASVRKLKGDKRPIHNEQDRAFVLSGLRAVDIVFIFDEDTPIGLIEEIEPDIHVKGGDYSKDDLPETPIIEGYGGKVVILPFVDGHSTSSVIEKLNK